MSSVDVIVPCYRYGHFLRECVESVLTQSGTSVRVLIIDDASPDNTAEVAADLVKEDPRVIFLRHTVNKGHIATYNEGIEWVSADYMLLLSADDYLLPGALSRSANLMDAYPEVGFVFGNVIRLSDSGTAIQVRTPVVVSNRGGWRILSGIEFIELTGSTSIVWTPTAVVRTKLQKQLGGYRTELTHTGDMEMWLRFSVNGSVGFLEAYQAVYRRHADNMCLNYVVKDLLAGVQQRKAALDCFFENNSSKLPNAEELRQRKFWSLGCEAIGLASTAFNAGKIEMCERLCEFALCLNPRLKRSLPWRKLACKRFIGTKSWHFLQPAFATFKRVAFGTRDR
jgi:glycosyltransferase involved in cell wall biosynthesis